MNRIFFTLWMYNGYSLKTTSLVQDVVCSYKILVIFWGQGFYAANLFSEQVNAPTAAPRGNETEGIQRNSGSQNQQPGQAFPRISLAEGMQIPLGAAIAVPSLNMVETFQLLLT